MIYLDPFICAGHPAKISAKHFVFLTTVLEPYPPREGIVPCVEGSGRWSGEWSRSLRTCSEQQWKQQCFGCTPCGAAHVVVACSFHCLPRCIETHCPSTRDGWCSMLHTWRQELDVGEFVPCISGSSSVTNPEFQSLRQRIDATLQQRGWPFDVLILSNAENDAHHKKIQKVHILSWTNSTGAWHGFKNHQGMCGCARPLARESQWDVEIPSPPSSVLAHSSFHLFYVCIISAVVFAECFVGHCHFFVFW